MKMRFFQLAQKISKHSDHPQHKLGAVIVKKNRVVSMGFNKNKTHPKSTHIFNRIHAELNAILKAQENIEGASIYIYREQLNGTLGLAKPCKSCQSIIMKAGIISIHYTSYDGYISEELK